MAGEVFEGYCIDCWYRKAECKCLDLAEYDEVAREAWDAVRRLEELTMKKGYNVRTKYIEQKLTEHREAVVWMHEEGYGYVDVHG